MQALMISLLMVINFMSLDCSTEEVSATKIERMPVTAAEVIDTVAVGQEVWFKATATTPSPCWKFHHFETSRKQNEVNVIVYAEYNDEPCVQSTGSLEAAGSIVLNDPGVYTFKFWQGKEETLNQKVVVQ